jgi:membrane protein required for colicin V production
VNFGPFLSGFGTIDLVIVLFFLAFFVLGFAQGTLRRLLGIGSILFSFLLAANLADPLGRFLGDNWAQFPRPYSYMIGLGTIFLAASVALALLAQGFYKPQPLFVKARFVDEILGGILGLVEAAIIFGAVLIILDTFFTIPGFGTDPQELPFVRQFWELLDKSGTAAIFRSTLIPAVFSVLGFMLPANIVKLYPR